MSWRSYSFDALLHRVRVRVGLVPSLAEAADELVEVCPAQDQDVPAAFSLPGQLERARASTRRSTLEYEVAHLLRRRMHHDATIAMRFERALLVGGVVYANGARSQHLFARERLLPRPIDWPEIEGLALPSSPVGNEYFGHFISDDCCAGYLARELAPVYFTSSGVPRGAHARRYLDVYGLPDRELSDARLRDVWLFQDHAMSPHKRERYRRMREKVRALPGSRSGHGVFFRRRGAGHPRGVVNEQAIEERLAREGFEIIDVSRDDTDTIIRRSRDAKIVCGVEGSALVHGVLSMAEGGALVCLQPPHRFSSLLKGHVDALGIHFGFVVGTGQRDHVHVSVDEIMRTLDLAWARVDA